MFAALVALWETVKGLFSGKGTVQVGAGNKSISNVTIGDNAGGVTIGQEVHITNVKEPPKKPAVMEVIFIGFVWEGKDHNLLGRFRLKNKGETSVRSPIVAIKLPDDIKGDQPEQYMSMPLGGRLLMPTSIWAMKEEREDFFEPNGRVAIQKWPPMNNMLAIGHSFTFDGLVIDLRQYRPATTLELEYRIDAEDMTPIYGKMQATVPSKPEGFLQPD